jgi:hypothetical protein
MSNRWVLVKKSVESGSGEGSRRASPDLPVLESTHFYGQSGCEKSFNGFRLAKVIGLAPSFEPFNDWSDQPISPCCGKRLASGKKFLKGGASYGMRSVLANFPLLQSSQRDR